MVATRAIFAVVVMGLVSTGSTAPALAACRTLGDVPPAVVAAFCPHAESDSDIEAHPATPTALDVYLGAELGPVETDMRAGTAEAELLMLDLLSQWMRHRLGERTGTVNVFASDGLPLATAYAHLAGDREVVFHSADGR